jgi:hypothetical protein
LKNRLLDAVHASCQSVDFRGPLESLLEEYRRGNFADPDRTLEDAAVETHLGDIKSKWDSLFPEFPAARWKRRTPKWEYYRGERDAYLQRLLVSNVPQDKSRDRLIVNPATVFGRHAMSLAHELPTYDVIGSDIDVGGHRLYSMVKSLKFPSLPNYRFEKENIFAPNWERRPVAVTFFGACGAVTDGCMDYAIGVEAPFLICRSCCHDNIGGNTEIVLRPSLLSWFFYFKNRTFDWINKRYAGSGFYFSDRHQHDAYPRSAAAREILGSDNIIEIARHSVESDICRFIIDLDRCLFLQENGYDVLYREELFFAHRHGR